MNAVSKTTATLALLAAFGFALTGCAGGGAPATSGAAEGGTTATQEAPAPQPVDLTGEWEQSNKKSETNFQRATIAGDTIEVYWIADGGDTKSLYWAGTVEAPSDGSQSFSWDSVNDKTKTESAMLASNDDTKKFAYENGELSYEVTAMGTTTTVRLAKK